MSATPCDSATSGNVSLPTLSRTASRRLASIGWAGTLVGLLWLTWRSPLENPLLLFLGGLIVLLAVWPALQWAAKARPWFPVFEISMLTGAVFYGMPLLAGHSHVLDFSEEIMMAAGLAFVGFQLVAIAVFQLTRGYPSRNPTWVTPLLPEQFFRYAGVGLWLNTAHLAIANYTQLIPWEFAGTFRAIFSGVSIVGTFLLSYRLGAGQLSQGGAATLAINLVAQVILLLSTLYLISSASLLLLALIGYVSASRRVPIVPLVIGFCVLAILHNGKSEMRRIYWQQNQRPQVALTELPAFFGEWVHYSLTQDEREKEGMSRQSHLVERASLFHILCLVVERVPEFDPYIGGESYIDIPALLIPRFIWPNKPSTLQSNVRLALHFGLVDEESANNVSIAFGPVAEAYSNFGWLGVLGFGAVLGWCMKRIVLLALGAPQFSALGLVIILLAAWSFQVEQVAATWISSLFQAAVVVIGVPAVAKKLFNAV